MLERLRKSDGLIKYAAAAVLLAVILYPKFPFIRVPGTYVSVRLEDFVVGMASLLALIKVLPMVKSIFKGSIERAIILFLGVGLVSLISAVFLTHTVSPAIGALHLIRRVEYFAPFFIGLVVILTQKDGRAEFFSKLLIVATLAVFIYGFGERYLDWPVIITQNEEYSKGIALHWVPGSHVNSTFAGHYDLATFLVMVMPIFIALLFTLRGKLTRIVLSVTVFSGLWLLSNAVHRISVVSYLVSACLALVLVKKYKAIPLILAVSIIFFALSGELVSRYESLTNVFVKFRPRIEKIIYRNVLGEVYAKSPGSPTPAPVPVIEDRSTSIRLDVEWPRAIRAFEKNPILGTGFSSITLATDNDFLRLLGELGILGLFSFLLIMIRVSLVYLKSLPGVAELKGVEAGFLAGVIAGSVGVVMNAMFVDVFEASKIAIVFWLLTGLAVGIIRANLNGENNN